MFIHPDLFAALFIFYKSIGSHCENGNFFRIRTFQAPDPPGCLLRILQTQKYITNTKKGLTHFKCINP